jgi:hypothetical protein
MAVQAAGAALTLVTATKAVEISQVARAHVRNPRVASTATPDGLARGLIRSATDAQRSDLGPTEYRWRVHPHR